MNTFTFTQLARMLELKALWEELVPQLHVGKAYRSLTPDTAKWFLEKGHKFNARTDVFETAHDICNEYYTFSQLKFTGV